MSQGHEGRPDLTAMEVHIYHPNGNADISNSRRFFGVYVFILNLNSLTKSMFTFVYLHLLQDKLLRKGRGHVYLIQIDGVLNVSGIC